MYVCEAGLCIGHKKVIYALRREQNDFMWLCSAFCFNHFGTVAGRTSRSLGTNRIRYFNGIDTSKKGPLKLYCIVTVNNLEASVQRKSSEIESAGIVRWVT